MQLKFRGSYQSTLIFSSPFLFLNFIANILHAIVTTQICVMKLLKLGPGLFKNFRALAVDAEETDKKRSLKKRFAGPMSKEFGQELPFSNKEDLEAFLKLGGQPPVLPPHLLQVSIPFS